MRFEIVFSDWKHDDAVSAKKFKTELEASVWIKQWKEEYDDVCVDKYGDEQWVTKVCYINPDDGEKYHQYCIRDCFKHKIK